MVGIRFLNMLGNVALLLGRLAFELLRMKAGLGSGRVDVSQQTSYQFQPAFSYFSTA
jgi:hypothetical protein